MAWDETFDVVVIGSGIAGVATALAAREAGCVRSCIEKARKLGGGTSFSMGGIWIGNNHLMRAAGYKDTPRGRARLHALRRRRGGRRRASRRLCRSRAGGAAILRGLRRSLSHLSRPDRPLFRRGARVGGGRPLPEHRIHRGHRTRRMAGRDPCAARHADRGQQRGTVQLGRHRQHQQLAEGRSGGAPRQENPHPRRRRHHPFRQAAPASAEWRSGQVQGPSGWSWRAAASPASSPTRAVSAPRAASCSPAAPTNPTRRWPRPTRGCPVGFRCSRRPSTATAS